MKPKHEDFDRLHQVLDEWQPELAPSLGFDTSLRRRIAALPQRTPQPWFAGFWPRLAAAGTLAIALGLFLYLGQNQPLPEEAAVTQAATVRDLQMWTHNSELLEHLDFLALPAQPTAGEQD